MPACSCSCLLEQDPAARGCPSWRGGGRPSTRAISDALSLPNAKSQSYSSPLVSRPRQWLLPCGAGIFPESSEGRRARQGRNHSSKEDKDAGIGGNPPLPKLLLGVYWAGIKQPGRVGSMPLWPAAGAPLSQLPRRASALGTQSIASSGGAEEGITGATWGWRDVRSCHQTEGSSLPFRQSAAEGEGWGKEKGEARSETSCELSCPSLRGSSLNPNPAGRREDVGHCLG